MIRVIVWDFDGTKTHPEDLNSPHMRAIKQGMVNLFGLDQGEGWRLASQLEVEIRMNPQQYGWIVDGKIVAPATATHLLVWAAIAETAFNRLGLYADRDERHAVLTKVYQEAYHFPGAPFRHNAAEVLHECARIVPHMYVVTNSVTAPVQEKLRKLERQQGGDPAIFSRLVDSVRGRAQKHHLVDDLGVVPHEWQMPGLSRPIYPRRGRYYEVLKSIIDQHDANWSDLLVIGDVFELDQALPYLLGAKIALMSDEHTPLYEREFVAENSGRARLITDLSEVPDWI